MDAHKPNTEGYKVDKIELLFIRACKSYDSHKRVHSVYNRFYYYGAAVDYAHVSNILLSICKKYDLITLEKMVDGLNPANAWKYGLDDGEGVSYHRQLCNFLISEIRLTEVSKLPEYIAPSKFKRALR